MESDDRLLRTGEVAALFGVCPRTITRWADAGTLPTIRRTLGGHRRYRVTDVEYLMTQVMFPVENNN